MRQPRPLQLQTRDAKTKQEDYFKNFRTRVVLLWLFSNALLIIVLTTEGVIEAFFPTTSISTQFNPFLSVIFNSLFSLFSILF